MICKKFGLFMKIMYNIQMPLFFKITDLYILLRDLKKHFMLMKKNIKKNPGYICIQLKYYQHRIRSEIGILLEIILSMSLNGHTGIIWLWMQGLDDGLWTLNARLWTCRLLTAISPSARRASHQPAFMGDCRTISPLHLVDELVLVFCVSLWLG